MKDESFHVLLALLMVSDPWPLSTGQECFIALLDEEARKRGFGDWIEAYNAMPSPR